MARDERERDILQIVVGALQGLASSTVFVLVLFIGFCVVVGFTKTKRTAGGRARGRSRAWTSGLATSRCVYFAPTAPRGPADQLRVAGTSRSGRT